MSLLSTKFLPQRTIVINQLEPPIPRDQSDFFSLSYRERVSVELFHLQSPDFKGNRDLILHQLISDLGGVDAPEFRNIILSELKPENQSLRLQLFDSIEPKRWLQLIRDLRYGFIDLFVTSEGSWLFLSDEVANVKAILVRGKQQNVEKSAMLGATLDELDQNLSSLAGKIVPYLAPFNVFQLYLQEKGEKPDTVKDVILGLYERLALGKIPFTLFLKEIAPPKKTMNDPSCIIL